MSAIDREALLNALHDCIDEDILIDGEGERYAISATGAADVTRWAADALGPLIDAVVNEAVETAVSRHVAQLLREKGAALSEAARLRSALDEIRRIFALQCPPMAREHYVDSGAWMAHRWWNTVLGGALERIAATEAQP